jgi:hypothetical protein
MCSCAFHMTPNRWAQRLKCTTTDFEIQLPNTKNTCQCCLGWHCDGSDCEYRKLKFPLTLHDRKERQIAATRSSNSSAERSKPPHVKDHHKIPTRTNTLITKQNTEHTTPPHTQHSKHYPAPPCTTHHSTPPLPTLGRLVVRRMHLHTHTHTQT